MKSGGAIQLARGKVRAAFVLTETDRLLSVEREGKMLPMGKSKSAFDVQKSTRCQFSHHFLPRRTCSSGEFR